MEVNVGLLNYTVPALFRNLRFYDWLTSEPGVPLLRTLPDEERNQA